MQQSAVGYESTKNICIQYDYKNINLTEDTNQTELERVEATLNHNKVKYYKIKTNVADRCISKEERKERINEFMHLLHEIFEHQYVEVIYSYGWASSKGLIIRITPITEVVKNIKTNKYAEFKKNKTVVNQLNLDILNYHQLRVGNTIDKIDRIARIIENTFD